MHAVLKWVLTSFLLLLPTFSLAAQAPDEPVGTIYLSYLMGDAGSVAIQAGERVTVTWENAPLDAAAYIFVWRSLLDEKPDFLMGIDLNPSDGVSILWKIGEFLGGKPYAAALYADGTWRYSPLTSLDYGSGKAPPPGVCSIGVASISSTPEVFDNPPNPGPYHILGYINDYVPVVKRLVDADGFPWLKIDLSAPHVLNSLDPTLPVPEFGWIYDHNVHLNGDCRFLD